MAKTIAAPASDRLAMVHVKPTKGARPQNPATSAIEILLAIVIVKKSVTAA
jgi:hypothetical protein